MCETYNARSIIARLLDITDGFFKIFGALVFEIVIVDCSPSENGAFVRPEAVLGDNGTKNRTVPFKTGHMTPSQNIRCFIHHRDAHSGESTDGGPNFFLVAPSDICCLVRPTPPPRHVGRPKLVANPNTRGRLTQDRKPPPPAMPFSNRKWSGL
ncbi:hypothetical protein AVEN_254420-1 [Araneus ventricosus]|uniref:Uncharacterized protein n=1 Tax=Araneus ventricosus TaxID=182803 RepID=A0A4Y2M3R9_ARAVE|nr:hypothetical protein AVEN_254420-1 [Araneus ventricosus]